MKKFNFVKLFIIFQILFFLYASFSSYIIAAEKSYENQNIKAKNILPKDSLGNLWIIVLDKSRSITTFLGILKKKFPGDTLLSRINFDKDHFFFMSSGIIDKCSGCSSKIPEAILKKMNTHKKFEEAFIHIESPQLIQFENSKQLKDYVFSQIYYKKPYTNSFDFCPYWMSFVSLIRPLSVYRFLNIDGMKENLVNFNRIYHLMITDDGDVNDQWTTDYRYIRYYAPDKLPEINKIIASVAVSDFSTELKKTGFFSPLDADTNQPKIYLSEYITHMAINKTPVLKTDTLIEIESLTLENASIKFIDNYPSYVNLFFIKKINVNGHLLHINKILYPDDILKITVDGYIKEFSDNNIQISGYYQEEYQDNVLGKRLRYKPLIESVFLKKTAEFYSVRRYCVVTLALLILFGIIWFIIRENTVLIKIYCNNKICSLRRKTIRKFKNLNPILLSFAAENEHFLNLKGINIIKSASKILIPYLIVTGKNVVVKIDNKLFKTNLTSEEDAEIIKKLNIKKIPFYIIDLKATKKENKQIPFFQINMPDCPLNISFEKEKEKKEEEKNEILKTNEFLITTILDKKEYNQKNNILINVFKLPDNNNKYVIALNIFDAFHENKPLCVWLKYYFMKCIDKNDISININNLKNLAVEILKYEKQKAGIYLLNDQSNANCELKNHYYDIVNSSFGIYLFIKDKLNTKSQTKFIYSPFKYGLDQYISADVFVNKEFDLYASPLKPDYFIKFNDTIGTYPKRIQLTITPGTISVSKTLIQYRFQNNDSVNNILFKN